MITTTSPQPSQPGSVTRTWRRPLPARSKASVIRQALELGRKPGNGAASLTDALELAGGGLRQVWIIEPDRLESRRKVIEPAYDPVLVYLPEPV